MQAQAAQDFEAVHAGQHDVEDNQLEVAAERRFETSPAFVFALDGIAFASEEFLEERAEFGVIVDDEYPHGSNVSRQEASAQ